MTCMAMASGVIKGLPLRHPIGTDAWAERFQLNMERFQFSLEEFRSLIELELCKALSQDALNVLMRMGLQKIQDHGIADRKLTIDGLWLSRQAFRQDV